MTNKVLGVLLLALLAFPLHAQTRVAFSASDESAPIMLALRGALLASPSFIIDRDTTHVRLRVFVFTGTSSVRSGTYEIKSVGVLIYRIGPNWRGYDDLVAAAGSYIVGEESEEVKHLLAVIDEASQHEGRRPRRSR